ncbi:MAG: DeoR/GlpR transcriptional regulator [Clostridia bacterium]|nr:DeoR/GlpR transcriptional regulator [Clostridia bacterium]
MKKIERQEQTVLRALREKNTLALAQVMELLDVSESTVRRLFVRLEERGVAIRRHGGIQLLRENHTVDYLYEKVAGQSVQQKEQIARYAAQCVESGDVLYVDSGTTMACFCSALAERLYLGQLGDLTVFTNSLVNLEILSPHVTVTLIGGEYRGNRRDFSGYLAEKMLDGLHFSKCFLGADGFHSKYGFTATDFSTAHLNELVLNSTDRSYVVIDSSKFSVASVVCYSRGDTVYAVITDKMPPKPIVEQLAELDIRLLLC